MMMVHDNSSEQHDVEDNERDEEGVPAPEETIDSVLTIPIQKKKKISAIEKTTDHHEQLIYQIDDESSFVATVENIVFEGKSK
ncbi:hypothetical protein RIR_jg22959.t1 [Rhizophagus irregularis DAOM 181602=DAOM 197198]|nr:hypothetical protein RIR_jg22959.t1 [Rhizophagus irregularis DAOM 181602=DAOM 197198]